jgi:predicted O-methyltransferase YrrM
MINLALERMNAIEGWLTEPEARLLYWHAEKATKWPIVEVGSYLGRSTVVLATAAAACCVPVIAIDPHEGELGRLDVRGPTFEQFRDNLFYSGCHTHVVPMVQRACDVVWAHPISMLFVDALHDYESVKADAEHFIPALIVDAPVVFHDYDDGRCPEWGVTRYVDELLASGWTRLGRADNAIAISAP